MILKKNLRFLEKLFISTKAMRQAEENKVSSGCKLSGNHKLKLKSSNMI